jgi:hypothetical protein
MTPLWEILLIGFTGTVFAAGMGLGAYFLARKVLGDKHPVLTAVLTATISAAIATMYTPWLTDRLSRHRDDRKTHRAAFKEVFKEDAGQLGGLRGELYSNMFVANADMTEDWGHEYQRIWRPENVLVVDLANHFHLYAEDRRKLANDLREHDQLYQKTRNELLNLVVAGKVGLSDHGLQILVRDELLNRCEGHRATFYVDNIQKETFDYHVTRGGVQMRIDYLPEFRVAENFFSSYAPPASVAAACERVRRGAVELFDRAGQLAAAARELAEGAALPGDCQYLRTE